MTKEVLIKISGLHMESVSEEELSARNDSSEDSYEEEEDVIEILVPGNYYFKNGKHYLFFEERIEGVQDVIKSQIKWKDNLCLEVSKKGLANMNMIYEKNKKTQCFYNTPYGGLNLGIFTSDIIVEETEENIDICVKYSMEANHQFVAESKICIRVQPRDAKTFTIL